MIQPVSLANYKALKILSKLKHDKELDTGTIVGKDEQPEDWDVIGFTATDRRTFLLLGKRGFGQSPNISAKGFEKVQREMEEPREQF